MKIITLKSFKLYYKPLLNYDEDNNFIGCHQYSLERNFMPVLIDKDGLPIEDVNLYLIYKWENDSNIDYETLKSTAKSLKIFFKWLQDEEIDYRSAPSPLRVPTYKYKSFLEDQRNPLLKEKPWSLSYVKNLMSDVVGFYRWLTSEMNVVFDYQLFKEKEIWKSYNDRSGNRTGKAIITTDIARFNMEQQDIDHTDPTISDGDKLRPLSYDEQLKFINVINNIAIEYKLMCLIAITTGARLQTVCTLRSINFQKDTKDMNEDKELAVHVGSGTLVDTKFQKSFRIYFPVWLYRQIQIYIASPRAKRNRAKAFSFDNDLHQYIFITQQGHPWYTAKNDPNLLKYNQPKTGIAVADYISKYIRPYLEHPFKFHDLRATFGTNYVDEHSDEKGNVIGESKVLKNLMDRMGHSNKETTLKYLKFRHDIKRMNRVEDKYQNELKESFKGLFYA